LISVLAFSHCFCYCIAHNYEITKNEHMLSIYSCFRLFLLWSLMRMQKMLPERAMIGGSFGLARLPRLLFLLFFSTHLRSCHDFHQRLLVLLLSLHLSAGSGCHRCDGSGRYTQSCSVIDARFRVRAKGRSCV